MSLLQYGFLALKRSSFSLLMEYQIMLSFQARALQELSKKVFHVLKTDPRNFELEFSATRRKPGRKPQGDAKGSNFSSPPKPTAIVRSRSMTYDGSSKGSRSLSGSPSLRRTTGVDPGCSGTTTHLETGDPEALFGKY